jgi:hypothetical protein
VKRYFPSATINILGQSRAPRLYANCGGFESDCANG